MDVARELLIVCNNLKARFKYLAICYLFLFESLAHLSSSIHIYSDITHGIFIRTFRNKRKIERTWLIIKPTNKYTRE